jgi:hypothetical protein
LRDTEGRADLDSLWSGHRFGIGSWIEKKKIE